MFVWWINSSKFGFVMTDFHLYISDTFLIPIRPFLIVASSWAQGHVRRLNPLRAVRGWSSGNNLEKCQFKYHFSFMLASKHDSENRSSLHFGLWFSQECSYIFTTWPKKKINLVIIIIINNFINFSAIHWNIASSLLRFTGAKISHCESVSTLFLLKF